MEPMAHIALHKNQHLRGFSFQIFLFQSIALPSQDKA